MSKGSYNESDNEHLFERPDDEMDLSIAAVVDGEADNHRRSVPRKTSHQNIKSGSYNEDLFPHPDDVLIYCIGVSDSETESWECNIEPPQDLEQLYWEQARKKENEYFELLYQEYGE